MTAMTGRIDPPQLLPAMPQMNVTALSTAIGTAVATAAA
jgi:hypothetical protein